MERELIKDCSCLECMNVNIEPAWVTAATTVVLVIVTTMYVILSWRIVQQSRKQAEEREKAQLRAAIYEPLLRNLESFVGRSDRGMLNENSFSKI